MAKAPFIGITMYGRSEKNEFSLPAEYVDAVRRAGGIPLLLPPGEEYAERWVEKVHAIVLAGGGDIDPELYGGKRHKTVYMVDAERDRTELALTHRIVHSDKPLLGICRGCQLINVALGGTLIEHIPEVYGQTVRHRVPPREPVPHTISIDAESRLARILDGSEVTASSWHHQALRRVASPLQVVARAPDGVIEAVEMSEHHWLLAVQWHPELTAASDPVQQRLFAALVEASR